MSGEIILTNTAFDEDHIFNVYQGLHDFSLEIYIDDQYTLDKQLKNKDVFFNCMESFKMFRNECFSEMDEDQVNEENKIIDFISDNFDKLLDVTEYVVLALDGINNLEFIKNNPMLLTKKIVLPGKLRITDIDILLKLIKEYNSIIDNIYINLDGNNSYVSLKDCFKTINEIRRQAITIKSMGLSPMEIIMYAYDVVRSRVYKNENKDESRSKSRDLSEVMFDDKIVCEGYANILEALLYYCGINCSKVLLQDKFNPDIGHARNIAYIKDSKYNIDGVYYFDPTWNSKRDNETNEYLYRYSFFALTKKQMEDKEEYTYQDLMMSEYSEDLYIIVKDIIDSGDYEKLRKYYKTINLMSTITGIDTDLHPQYIMKLSPFYGKFDTQKFLSKFKVVFNKFHKELSAETLIKVLSNVRKIEYYQNPSFFPYSEEDLYKTFIYSDWKFKKHHLSPQVKFMKNVCGINVNKKIRPVDDFNVFCLENNVFKDIHSVKIAKLIKDIHLNKINNERK